MVLLRLKWLKKRINTMRLIKYDGISDKSVKAILGSSGSSSSGGSDVGSRSEYTDLNRTIWG